MNQKEKTQGEWAYIANNNFFELIGAGKPFTADDFYALARRDNMPPHLIKRFVGALFRQFKAAGYIQKAPQYRLSTRNNSTPLPIWVPVPMPVTGKANAENLGNMQISQ